MIFFLIKLVVSLDIHITPDTELSLTLPDIIKPSNFSCSISGSFNISTSVPPEIQGGLSKVSVFSDPLIESPSVYSTFGKTLYSGSRKLSLFNISNPFNISKLGDLDIGQSPIIAVQPAGNLLITVEGSGLFRVINMTSSSEITFLQVNSSLDHPISCVFLQDLDYWWAFFYNSSSMVVVKFEFTKTFSSGVFKTLNLSSFAKCSGLMTVNIVRSIFYICDIENGILTYDLSPVIYSLSDQPSFISNFRHPLYFGEVRQCSLNQQVLTVSTKQALIVYQIPFLAPLRVYSGSFGLALTSGDSTFAYTQNRFQVFNNSLSSFQVPVADNFVNVTAWTLTDGFLITAGESQIVVFHFLNPFVTFRKQGNNYRFIGKINCDTDFEDVTVLGSFSSGIFDYRGVTQESGYDQPEVFNNYTYGAPFELFLPLSNYFSGNNLKYSIDSEKGSAKMIPFESKRFSLSFPGKESKIKLIQGKNVVVTTEKTIYSVILNPNFTLNYSAYIQKSSNVQIITCTSLSNSLVYIEYLNSNQMNFHEILSETGKVIYSESILQEDFCDNLMIVNDSAMIQRASCIETYNISRNEFELLNSSCFLGATIEISVCVSFCVLINRTFLYQYSPDLKSGSLIYEFSESVNQVLSSSEFLVAVSDSTIFKFELPNFSVFQFPVLCDDSTYSISAQYLSSYCQELHIIDLFSPSFSSIIEKNDYLSNIIFDPFSLFPTIGLTLAGNNLEIYAFGNNFSSELIPKGSKVSSVWAFLNISNKLTELEDLVSITAQSETETMNKTVKINLWNTQFLEKNPDFDPNSNRLTSGIIDLTTQEFSEVVPQYSFIGNNLTFGLIIDEKLIKPSNNCLILKTACIEQKYFKLFSIESDLSISDFFVNGKTLITSVGPMINFYDRSDLKLQKSFRVVDKLSRIFQCLSLVLLSSDSVICTGVYSSSGLAMYYILLISADGTVQDSYQIYYQADWLMVSEVEDVHIYVYDGFGLYSLKVAANNTIDFVNYYSSALFGTAFYPVSADFFNETAIIVGEKYSGICLIIDDQLVQLAATPYNSSLIDFFLIDETVLMLTESGEGYLISLESSLVLKHYYKLYPTGYIPGNMQSAINLNLNLLVYPIYTNENSGFLRVLNYKTGQILTDIYLSSFKPYSYFRRIVLTDDPVPRIYHDLAVSSGSVTLQVLAIRSETKAYLQPLEKDDSFLQLSASVGENSLKYSKVILKYARGPDSSDSSSSNVSSKWWFWVILCGGLTFLALAVVLCILLYKRLKVGKSSDSEPLVINY